MAEARRAESAGAPRCVRGARDLEPAPGGSRRDPGYRRRGVVELREELQETKPAEISGMGTGGDIVEEDRRSEAEQGAADEGEQGQLGAGARGPVEPEKEEGGGGLEPPQQEQQLQEPSHVAPEGLQPRDRQPGLPRRRFTGLRLKGLQSVFRRTQYPDVFSARKELAVLLDVAEARAPVGEPEHGDSAGPPV